VKLSSVATDVMGASGRDMMRALIAGRTDPDALAELARGKLRAKLPQLRKALATRFKEHHAFLLERMLAHVQDLEDNIAALSERIEASMSPFSAEQALLCTIPGVGEHAAEVLGTEIGIDMAQFPTAGHLASWAGMCPGQRESRLASADRPRPARAPSGCARRSSSPPGGRRAWTAPTCESATCTSAVAGVTRRPSSPSPMRSSSPPTGSCPPQSPTTTPVQSHCAGSVRSTSSGVPSLNSGRSATRSPSSPARHSTSGCARAGLRPAPRSRALKSVSAVPSFSHQTDRSCRFQVWARRALAGPIRPITTAVGARRPGAGRAGSNTSVPASVTRPVKAPPPGGFSAGH
jgi:hypothetical protein